MKTLKYLFVLITFGLISYSANAQTELIYDGGVYQNDIKLTAKEVSELMKDNKKALIKYESGKGLQVAGTLIAVPSTLFTGLGIYLYEYENKKLLGTIYTIMGGTGMILGVTCILVGKNKMKEAVEIYNKNLNNKKVAVNFGFTGNGVGLNVRF